MTRRTKVWLAVLVLFTLVNVAGAGIAAADAEWIHTGIHAGLVFLGEFLIWRLVSRRPVRA